MQENDYIWVEETIAKILEKMKWVSEKSREKLPSTSINGIHDNKREYSLYGLAGGVNWWTNGFFAGIMWQMYYETKDIKFADIASNTELWLDKCFDDFYGLHHDVGFMWLPSAVAHYRLLGNTESKKRGLHAATILAGRFNAVGKFIRAWNGYYNADPIGWAIIDCLLNTPLLYWASEETKDPRFSQIAQMHADTVIKEFIREDGSCEHIVEFDPYSGKKIKTHGGQGFCEGSSWTRGQAWAIYGLMLSYIHTKEKKYLNASKKVADYFIKNIPENGIIPIDFLQPEEPKLEDSTASAIASCGLIELSKHIENNDEKEKFYSSAIKMLKVLESKRSVWSKDDDCIIQNCSMSYYDKQGHHVSLIYADYFFIEAMLKLNEDSFLLW